MKHDDMMERVFVNWQEDELYATIYRFVNPNSRGCEDDPNPVDPAVEATEKRRVAEFVLECAIGLIESEGLAAEFLDYIQVAIDAQNEQSRMAHRGD